MLQLPLSLPVSLAARMAFLQNAGKPGLAAIAHVGGSSLYYSGASNSLTFSLVVPAGSHLVLVVHAMAYGISGAYATGVTFHNVSMGTAVQVAFLNSNLEWNGEFVLANPNVGTYNVVVTYVGSPTYQSAVADVYSGVSQSAPVAHFNNASGTTRYPSVSVATTILGNVVCDGVLDAYSLTHACTAVGETKRQDEVFGASSDMPSGSSGTVTGWDFGSAGLWNDMACELVNG